VRIIHLPSLDGELIVLDLNLQIVQPETRHRQRDAQPIVADLLDIVRRVAFRTGFCDAVQSPFEMIETQKQGTVEQGQARHLPPSSSSMSELPNSDRRPGLARRRMAQPAEHPPLRPCPRI